MKALTFNDLFTGVWYHLNGYPLSGTGVWENGLELFHAKIKRNGENTLYNFTSKYDFENAPVISPGLIGEQFDENGLVNRNYEQLAIINHKLDVITEMLENQKDMLTDIHAELYDQYLAEFDRTFGRMVSNCNEITNALNANENLSEIEALIAKLEEGGDEEITNEEIQQFYKELSAIARDSKSDDGADPASYYASLVATDFKTLCGYFKTSSTNPILQRRALHSLTDNFSTTSYAEDMAYEMEIQTQLNRALTLMKLVKGSSMSISSPSACPVLSG